MLYSRTNPILWEDLVLRYGPKCSLPIRLQDFYMVNIKILQSNGQRAFWRVSLEEMFAC